MSEMLSESLCSVEYDTSFLQSLRVLEHKIITIVEK